MSWSEWFSHHFSALLVYAAKNPWEFLFYVLLILSPLFAISAFFSWKLAKEIEREKKEKARKARRQENIAKATGKRKSD